jgi:hypothetical protein
VYCRHRNKYQYRTRHVLGLANRYRVVMAVISTIITVFLEYRIDAKGGGGGTMMLCGNYRVLLYNINTMQ